MRKSKIPTIIGLIVLVFGLAAGVLLVGSQRFFRLGAEAELAPKDVRLSNISDNSFTVSWVTDKETGGFVKWGETAESLDKTELDEVGGEGITHTASIRGLSPEKVYYFKINSGGDDFDNSGIPWQVTLAPSLPVPDKTNLVSGSVLTESGQPAKNALVYITLGGGSLLSSVTSDSGSWVIPISQTRSQDLTGFIDIDEKNTLMEISVNAGVDGVANAQIYPQSAKPVPAIILGETHDFKNLPPSEISEIPQASIGLPEESTPSSKFEVEEQTQVQTSQTVTLESLEEGEVVSSTKPEFFGEGPVGITISITVESEPVTGSVRVSPVGDWNWSPPAGLSEGTHRVTISWRDAQGILRTLTRTFVVQAAEGPAFESTPSASLTPTPTPTPSPTLTPTPTPTPTVTGTPAATASPTISPVADSGSLTPTILLSIMGVSVIAFAFLVWKKSEI
jgi:hypothetical protein